MTDHAHARNGLQSAQSQSQTFVRPLAFAEALKFTPLTTSPLQPSDQIPLPAIEAGGHRVSLASEKDKNSVAGVKLTPDVQNELRRLLQPKELSEFKFKKSPSKTSGTFDPRTLSALASHVYNGTPMDYQSPSQDSTPKPQNQAPTPVVEHANTSAFAQNFSVHVPSSSKPESRSLQPIIAIKAPVDFQSDEYSTAPNSPKRRKLHHGDREAELALRLRTQQEQGDAAVFQFQGLLADIFSARDRIGQGDESLTASNSFFEPAEDDDDFTIQFTTTQLARLYSRLRGLLDLKRLDDISHEDINQLRQLCDGPVRRSQGLNLRLNRDPSDEDVEVWQSRIKSAEIGATSASIILLTALGDKGPQLPADIFQAISSVLVNTFESCLIPAIEARPDGPAADLFRCASANEKALRSLLEAGKKLLDQLATVCVQVKEAADCLNATEFLAARLIFVQNGHTDKVAALGVKTYERARKQVMSSLARLFAAFPGDRKSIMDEILSSVDKLPSTSRSARQFSLGDSGMSIMLVTALFVQLVQSSALADSRKKTPRTARSGKGIALDGDDEAASSDEDELGAHSPTEDGLSSLRRKKEELLKPAMNTSNEIVSFLVAKASKVTKTGDSPYRNILDLFIEDLVVLMPFQDWPATQSILERMCFNMMHLAQHDKAAGVKNMALESLGTMGAGIASARVMAQASAAGLIRGSADDSELSQSITRLANDQFTRGLSKEELLGPDGPFAMTCMYYNQQAGRKESKSLRARSAQSFYLAQYAHFLCQYMAPEAGEEAADTTLATAVDIMEEIDIVAADGSPISFVGEIHPREASLAYLLSIMSGGFCRRYEQIAQTLLASLGSDQAQVRARSLKSIVTMLETDLSLLEMPNMRVEQYVFPCASDDSANVRDAALALIAKFLIAKPSYEERGIRQLIQCAQDEKIGVKKRAISHLADVYAADHRPSLKTTVAETFLVKTVDNEDSVSELAKRTLADAWFTTHLSLADQAQDSAQASVAIEELTQHIADTLARDIDELPTILTKFIAGQLRIGKNNAQLGRLLSRIVGNLFNLIVAGKAQSSSLRLLVSLAQARPECIAPTQLSHLRQYIKNLASPDDLVMFRAVIDIFRHVLPRLSTAHRDLLGEIQGDLFTTVPKLPLRVDLDNVMSCLRTIDNVLHNSIRFVKLLKSIVEQLRKLELGNVNLRRLVFIVGSLAKQIDIDNLNTKGHIEAPPGVTTSALIADLLYPFARQSDFEDLQWSALDSLGCVCQAWPARFEKKQTRDIFLQCLELADGTKPRSIALRTFEELFSSLGDDSETDQADKDKAAPAQDLKKMGGNAKVQSDNSAIAGIAQAVFARVVKIALSTSGSDLVLAARTVASMSKRGMFHPKDYAGVFVALETSEVAEVRAVAEEAHRKAHTQHESFWEREYMQAVQSAFRYQLQTAQEPSGIRQGTAKLGACFNIINTSGSKYVKKFLSNLISRLSVDRAKMDLQQKLPTQVLFVQFVVQNIAFFEFARMEDLLHAILQLDLLFGTGNEISETIETTLPIETPATEADPMEVQQPVDALDESASLAAVVPRPSLEGVDLAVLGRLAAAACAMTMISEARSHLKRQYGISRDVRATMAQNKQAKEGGKPPIKVHGITGERFVNSTSTLLQSLETPEAMLDRCREFHRLMNIDEELVVGDEGDGTGDQNELMAPAAPRGKKRKSAGGSTGGTPRKRGRPRKNATPTRRSSSASSHNDPDADFMG